MPYFAKVIEPKHIVDYDKWKDKLASLEDAQSEDYWETWEDVLANLRIIDGYKHYSLYQDGALWLIPSSSAIKWVTDKEELSDSTLHDRYDECLNDCYGTIKICGYDYAASQAFKETDPTAYRCEFNNWTDAEVNGREIFLQDGKYYDEDPSEPEDYWDDPESHDGHYEWIVVFGHSVPVEPMKYIEPINTDLQDFIDERFERWPTK